MRKDGTMSGNSDIWKMFDIRSEITETIVDPVKTNNRAWEMAKSANEEILILFSSANGFARQDKLGAVEIIKDLSRKRRVNIRILTTKNKRIEELRSELKNYNIVVKYIQEFSQTKITMMVVDRKSSFVIEIKKDDATNTLDAVGQSTYSTRILTVLSYVSDL